MASWDGTRTVGDDDDTSAREIWNKRCGLFLYFARATGKQDMLLLFRFTRHEKHSFNITIATLVFAVLFAPETVAPRSDASRWQCNLPLFPFGEGRAGSLEHVYFNFLEALTQAVPLF